MAIPDDEAKVPDDEAKVPDDEAKGPSVEAQSLLIPVAIPDEENSARPSGGRARKISSSTRAADHTQLSRWVIRIKCAHAQLYLGASIRVSNDK